MAAKSDWATEAGDQFPKGEIFELHVAVRVRDIRDELGRRVPTLSAKSALTLADRLELLYYQKLLKFIEPLPPETWFNTGTPMAIYRSSHLKEARELEQVLDYLNLLHAPPVPARLSSKGGRPITGRPSALPALQLRIDGLGWMAITQKVCDCSNKEHNQRCKEAIRQRAIGLKRFLKTLGVELPS